MSSKLIHPNPNPFPKVHAKGISSGNFKNRRPKILLVTPEIGESSFLAKDGRLAPCVKAGGLADIGALLVDTLNDAGAEVHVALPHFRSLFKVGPAGHSRHLHLCQDREFSYRQSVYDGSAHANLRASLAFQRDVIHYVMPRLRPDVVHCHDWMTGLVPAAARVMGIPSLFTLHNHHDMRSSLVEIEDRGIDAAGFWQHLYYHEFPGDYETIRNKQAVSMLASGILAADAMNTVSRSFLNELGNGGHGASGPIVNAIREKLGSGRAEGILNSLPPGMSPHDDSFLPKCYDAASHVYGKRANKRALQQKLGLELDDDAPLLFWPSRLDPIQKGCQLLAEVLYKLVSDYWGLGLQVVFIADGPFRPHFEHIARFHQLEHRIAVHGFDPKLSRMGYAGSDYTLMPSAYEPCGLSQMIGLRYGSLPIVHATGGLKDTVRHLDCNRSEGNGFAFEVHDPNGLRWAIDEAMRFHIRPLAERSFHVGRIMSESADEFATGRMVDQYLGLYRKLLETSVKNHG